MTAAHGDEHKLFVETRVSLSEVCGTAEKGGSLVERETKMQFRAMSNRWRSVVETDQGLDLDLEDDSLGYSNGKYKHNEIHEYEEIPIRL